MTDSKDHLGLVIPEQLQASSKTFDVRPKKVDAWLQALPLADIGETTQLLLSALTEINRTEMVPATRFKIAGQLSESVNYATQNLKKNFIGHQLPYSPRCHKYVKQTFALLEEAANTYKIITVQLLNGSYRYDKKLAAYSIYRTINLHCKTLLTSYQIYALQPPGIWHELHRLFYLAELKGLLDKSINDPENKLSKNNCIDKIYRHALLLSLSNPYRLRKGEIEKIHTALDRWSQYAVIYDADSRPDSKTSLFVCNLETDMPPELITSKTRLHDNHSRILDISRLNDILHKEIEDQNDASNEKQTDTVDRNLIKRLLQSWEQRNTRNFSRIGANSSMEISMGLGATHQHMNELANHADNPTQNTGGISNLSRISMELTIEPIADSSVMWGQPKNERIHASDYIDRSSGQSSFPKPQYSLDKWKTINVSAGGYCLLWENESPSPAQVGELIGIRDTHADEYHVWNIGVVRWMQYSVGEGLKLGIQILAPNALPIMTRSVNTGPNTRKKPHNSLVLEGVKSLAQPATLLTPTIHYRVGDTLILDDHGATAIVQLTKQLEITGDFVRYEYTPVNADKEYDLQREIKRHAMELNTRKD